MILSPSPGTADKKCPHTGKIVVVDPAEPAASVALQLHRHDVILVALEAGGLKLRPPRLHDGETLDVLLCLGREFSTSFFCC
jgi:hypothetical protein